ncbi:MAG: alpha/beta hydrolase [Alphaproteobacteria bacterium]
MSDTIRTVRTGRLEIAWLEQGPADGPAAILLHGFPYDVHAYSAVTARLADAGVRSLTPYLRGYGPTRFLAAETPRSGEQAALGADLRDFMNAIRLEQAVLAGYDWGGRAACVVAALWPERATGLVTGAGYNIQNVAASARPAPPAAEHRYWYQYYFHTPRGRAGLEANRNEMARLLWRLWSPEWTFSEETFLETARSFDNPDFVEVVIHSYRVRYGYADGDAAYAAIEAELAKAPDIRVPTINLHGLADGVHPAPGKDRDAAKFVGGYERRLLEKIGHNVPQEAPEAFADAVIELARRQP